MYGPVSYTHLNEINLGEGSVGRLLLTLAVPSVIAQLVNLLYNLVDRIYIGHIPVSYTHLDVYKRQG